eukprot:5955402-Prymnesium_polylepis.1
MERRDSRVGGACNEGLNAAAARRTQRRWGAAAVTVVTFGFGETACVPSPRPPSKYMYCILLGAPK